MSSTEISWKFYLDTKSAWQAIEDTVKAAEKSIDLELFILHNDQIGKPLLETLKEKAKRGINVRLLIDWLGSRHTYLLSNDVPELRDAGINIIFFNPLAPWDFRYKTFSYYRDHNKNIIVDSRAAFTGGICVSSIMENWRETTVKVEGSLVEQMQTAFDYMWNHADRKSLRIFGYAPSALENEFSFILNIPHKGKRYLFDTVFIEISKAKREINITNPYFVPTDNMFRLLKTKAKEGVSIRLITPRNPDSKIAKYATQYYIGKALKAGIRVYYYNGTVNHAKTITIDNNWSSVGSMNFDRLSLVHNFEGNIISTNKDFIKELNLHFQDDLKDCEELELGAWIKRPLIERFLTRLISIFRKWL